VIFDTITSAGRYTLVHPRFAAAFAFLREPGTASLPPGRHAVEGDALYVVVASKDARPLPEAVLEAHRRYIDIHLVLAGTDHMAWRALSARAVRRQEYEAETDCELLDEQPALWLPVQAGEFAVFFPEDAHAAMHGDGHIHKVIAKVLL
jgi:YhcH/YjgK/YiaL family protein